jgi:hypothetical protein
LEAPDSGREPKPPRWPEWVVPAVCCVLLSAQLFLSVRRLSVTCDEPTHLYAGYRAWKCGDFSYASEHPPLARLIAAAPLLTQEVPVSCAPVAAGGEIYHAAEALNWLYRMDFQRNLLWSRAAVSVFALVLCLLIWMMARQMFGFWTAVVATVLFLFDPTVLAYGALATTDMAIACTFLLAVFAFYLWTKKKSVPRLLFAGVSTGLALAAKQSGILLFPLLGLLAVGDGLMHAESRRKSVARNLAGAALSCGIAIFVLWGVYGFRYAARPEGPSASAKTVASGDMFAAALDLMQQSRLLPEAYVDGLQGARSLALEKPRGVVLLGRTYSSSPWFFFPLNLAIKYTVPMLALILLAAFASRKAFIGHGRELLFLLLPPGLYLLVSMNTRISSGIRHQLPVTAFLLIVAAAGGVAWVSQRRWLRYGMACVLLFHAATSLHAFPYYLSYSNELWGGTKSTYRHLPNNDLGEALEAVKPYLDRHPGEPCWYASVYLMSIKPYHLPCRFFWAWGYQPIPPHLHGIVIVSSAFFSRAPDDYYLQADWMAPFLQAQPAAYLGGSAMLAYEGDFDTHSAAAVSEIAVARAEWDMNHPAAAREHARRALDFQPGNPEALILYCSALVRTNEPVWNHQECRTALATP